MFSTRQVRKQRVYDPFNLSFRYPATKLGVPLFRKTEKEIRKKPISYAFNERKYGKNSLVHFFLDDYRFSGLWSDPQKYERRIKGKDVWGVCSPDFSVDETMPIFLQMYQVYRSRWIAARWQEAGIHVVLTLQWAGELSHNFAFQGVEAGVDIAIDCSRNLLGHELVQYEKGLSLALEKISPGRVFCFGDIPSIIDSEKICVYRYPRTHFERKGGA